LETLDRKDEAAKLVLDRSTAENVKPEFRAEAFVSMAAKKYTCANDISDVEPVKKTVKKDGKDVYQYTKPTDPAQFDKLKACATDGMKLIEQAVALEPAGLKDSKDIDPVTAPPAEVEAKIEMLKIFASAYSYRANLFYQNMRVAEMEGNTAEKDALKAKGDEARTVFASFSEAEKKIETAKENKKKSDSEKKKEEEKK
jgi:hypothetical protein